MGEIILFGEKNLQKYLNLLKKVECVPCTVEWTVEFSAKFCLFSINSI